MKKARKLSNVERSEIEILLGKNYSIRSIAKALGRSPNTISLEIRRNRHGNDARTSVSKHDAYLAAIAKQKTYVRRKYAKYQGKKINEGKELKSFIITKLKQHHSPDEIAGMMKVHQACVELCTADCTRGLYSSKTAIYEWLRTGSGAKHAQHLYSGRDTVKKRKTGTKTKRQMIPSRIGIEHRPLEAENRSVAGHFEYDSIVSSKTAGSTAALAVVIDRATRLVRASLVSNLKPEGYANTIVSLCNDLQVKTLTTDNGIENRHHRAVTEQTGADVYFTDPYSSWQKGAVENANKMIRRYFPKGTDFSTVNQTEVNTVLNIINNKPRKILGYKTALEAAKEKGLFKSSVLIEG